MDNEIAERMAMALEHIELAITRQADAQEKVLADQARWIEEQREAQKAMAARLGMVRAGPVPPLVS